MEHSFITGKSSPSSFMDVANTLAVITLTTVLIWENVTPTLVLGNSGSAGLVWSTVSVFGALSAIRACMSGASSGSVRSLLGLRSKASDAAVGLDLELARDPGRAVRVRHTLDDPLGVSVSCEAKTSSYDQLSKEHPSCKDIYAFDRPTTSILEGVTSTSPGDKPMVHIYDPRPFVRNRRDTYFQLSALAFSLIKWGEVYYQWTNGARSLAVASALPFSFFFVVALILECRQIFYGTQPTNLGSFDLIAGPLPTFKKIGGQKKIVVGLPTNPRTSIGWRLLWSIGAFLYSASLIVTYFVLRRQPRSFVRTWAAFQICWFCCQSVVFKVCRNVRKSHVDAMVVHDWEGLDPAIKERVFSLTLAVAKYQIHVHPRDARAYRDDSFSPRQVRSLLAAPNKLHLSYPLPSESDMDKAFIQPEVIIVAVIGDTAITSAGWVSGSKVLAKELYDACIVVFSLPSQSPDSGSRTVAVPAVRVLSGVLKDENKHDNVQGPPLFVPRGAGSAYEGLERTWWYWIPCDGDRWLQIRSEGLTVLGKRKGEILNNPQLTALLSAGKLNIDMAHAEEVKAEAELTRTAAESLLYLLH